MKLLIVICLISCVSTQNAIEEMKSSPSSLLLHEAENFDEDNIDGSNPYYVLRKLHKRNVNESLEKVLGKPLELGELETVFNYTEILSEPKNGVLINDFIRFKRETEETTKSSETAMFDVDNSRSKREHEQNEKMLMSTAQPEGSREPRGATKDQWVKQPYSIQTTNPHNTYDDSTVSASESARAPRVHFVTQRRLESAPPLVYHSYGHDGSSRDFNRHVRDPDYSREPDLGYYPRISRHYSPYRPGPYYHRDDRDRRPDYDYSRVGYYKDDRPAYNKQRRIIYYATLPEIVRSPHNVDLRDRNSYRDRYNSRYVTSPTVSIGQGENFRFRNENPYSKSRYDEANKTAYPAKVSTDVNVREIKKNPERRIYSEADRRYAYKVPNYRHDEAAYERNK